MLCDHLVAGIANSRMQIRLLAKDELTFQRAYNLAIAMEMTNKDSHDLKHQTTALPVNPLRASVGVTTAAEGGPNLLMATATECYRCSGKHKYSQEGLHRWHVLPNVARDTLRFDNRMHDKSLWSIHQKTWRTLRLFTLRSLCLATEQELR